jgi:hypothetical protein
MALIRIATSVIAKALTQRLPLGVFIVGTGLLISSHAVAQDKTPAAEPDAKPPITLRGTITKTEWANPHSYFYIDVPDATGNMTNWKIEAAAPNALLRRGWSKSALTPGTEITVSGFLPKNTNKLMTGYALKLDGKTWSIGPSDVIVPDFGSPAEDPCTLNPSLPVCSKLK